MGRGLLNATTSGRVEILRRTRCLSELGVLPHPVAVAANRHQVAVMDEPIDERGGHHVVAKDVAQFLEAFIGREPWPRVLLAARHELKASSAPVRMIGRRPDVVYDRKGGIREHRQPRLEPPAACASSKDSSRPVNSRAHALVRVNVR